ncbi:hypothetical protein [Verrucosispora sp. WMMD573]|uniref:hypothetical protein n=1 Tax=Verrucosispora sp. WMMD573 TaxID=3015149 RepID=UPI00248B2148|nr:hypothetical protein [Verrucosispora sp. WMMD573]WBB56312.1 hypothetical protein O7601_09670 [Verrucosispora sp. WMMD573]
MSADRREAFLDGVAEVVAGQPGGMVADNYVTALYTVPRRNDSALLTGRTDRAADA